MQRLRGARSSGPPPQPGERYHCYHLTDKEIEATGLAALEQQRQLTCQSVTTGSQGQPSLSPLWGEQLQEMLSLAWPRSTPLDPAGPTALLVPYGRTPGGLQVQEKVARLSGNPARFSELFSSPPSPAGSSQWTRGAFRPQPIRRQQGALSPAPLVSIEGEPPWSVCRVTCVRWDWLAPRREGSRLASEDGPIPRACGLARTESSLSLGLRLWAWMRASVRMAH